LSTIPIQTRASLSELHHTNQQKCVYKARNKNNRLLEAILHQLAGETSDKEDAAQWIVYYLCLHHKDAFLAAVSSLSLCNLLQLSKS
jgi:hypothetical protein